ncbi:SHOCT domain-containing protein [Marinitoga litoralis]|uniref:SHOCT domain-containing protein n=1 Tax=Marinitoga litoralis TaxID=570855 RepID=UPI00195FDBF3|nr:SHOCT domain-containing protein [Marinitoga litoralis]MBM7559762.1 putative membrane protein [Marinitoga litoralis]
MPCWGWSGFYGYGIIGSLVGFGYMVLFLILIYFIFKNLFKNNHSKQNQKNKVSNEDVLKILNEKFVKGEITEEEYIRKKKLIE